MMHRRRTNRGVALISVLLVVALVSALAYQMVTRHSLTVAQTRQVFHGAQAREYAIGAEMFARQLLFEDWSNEASRDTDTLLEAWAQPAFPFEIEDGVLELMITDLDGRFNLNTVTGSGGPESMQRLKRMMNNLGLDQNLADAWLDWVDDDFDVHGFGAEDGEYLLAEPAYRAANQPASSVSELLAIANFTKADFDLLSAHTTVLPTTDLKINVNTAGYEVMRALSPNFSAADAQTLVESPREFTDVPSITAQYAGLGDSVNIMAVTSEYFEVRVRAEVASTRTELTSTLHRDPTTGKIRLLARDFGQHFKSVFEPEEP